MSKSKQRLRVKEAKASSIYETEPVGYKKQPDFLNQVIEVQTALAPEILMQECLKIKTSNLAIPHPRMHERAFVLVPFAEIKEQISK